MVWGQQEVLICVPEVCAQAVVNARHYACADQSAYRNSTGSMDAWLQTSFGKPEQFPKAGRRAAKAGQIFSRWQHKVAVDAQVEGAWAEEGTRGSEPPRGSPMDGVGPRL